MALADVQQYIKLVPAIKKTPQGGVWCSYDKEADTLYVNFKKPSHATDSKMTPNDIIIRYERKKIVGFTVLHASRR